MTHSWLRAAKLAALALLLGMFWVALRRIGVAQNLIPWQKRQH